MPFLQLLMYLTLCAFIGLGGKKLPLGFGGFFLISFFFTPPIGLLILILLLVFVKGPVVVVPVPTEEPVKESEKT